MVLATGALFQSSFARTTSGCTPTAWLASVSRAALGPAPQKLGVPLVEGVIHSSDVFYRHDDRKNPAYWELLWDEKGCVWLWRWESFALFHNAAVLGKRAACLCNHFDSFCEPPETTPKSGRPDLQP